MKTTTLSWTAHNNSFLFDSPYWLLNQNHHNKRPGPYFEITEDRSKIQVEI
jgi:hypothetical protein